MENVYREPEELRRFRREMEDEFGLTPWFSPAVITISGVNYPIDMDNRFWKMKI